MTFLVSPCWPGDTPPSPRWRHGLGDTPPRALAGAFRSENPVKSPAVVYLCADSPVVQIPDRGKGRLAERCERRGRRVLPRLPGAARARYHRGNARLLDDPPECDLRGARLGG